MDVVAGREGRLRLFLRSGRSWQCVGAREAGSLYCPVHGREVRAKNRRFAAKRAAKKAADALDDLLK